MATTTKLPELPKKKKNSPSPVKSNSKPKKEAKNIAPQGNDSPNQTNRSKNKKSVLVNSFANIPRNVNLYRHLITEAATTETDIRWILGLRLNTNIKNMKRSTDEPFRVYGQDIEGRKEKKTFSDIDTKGDVSKFEHLVFGRLGPSVSKSLVSFETTLRNYGSRDVELKKKEMKFKPYPFKERNEFPKFLPKLKEELEMRSKTKSEIFDIDKTLNSAFVGKLDYPKYDIRFSKKNINDYLHLAGKDIDRGTIEWEVSLR